MICARYVPALLYNKRESHSHFFSVSPRLLYVRPHQEESRYGYLARLSVVCYTPRTTRATFPITVYFTVRAYAYHPLSSRFNVKASTLLTCVPFRELRAIVITKLRHLLLSDGGYDVQDLKRMSDQNPSVQFLLNTNSLTL